MTDNQPCECPPWGYPDITADTMSASNWTIEELDEREQKAWSEVSMHSLGIWCEENPY